MHENHDLCRPLPDETKSDLIQALYEAAVNPQVYDQLVELWGRHLEHCLGSDLHSSELPQSGPDAAVSPEISQHLMRAFDILDRLGRSDDISAAPYETGRAELHLSRSGRISWCSPLAANALGVSAGDMVFNLPMSVESQPRLHRYLKRCADLKSPPDKDVIFVFFTADDNHPYPMLPDPETSSADHLVLRGLYHQWSAAHDKILQQMFGLTDAELRVSRDLLTGASLRDIAEATGRSVDTLRTQLKSVRRKTYTSNQQQLVRIMTGLEALIQDGNAQHRATDRLQDFILPDGRKLCYRLLGPSDGLPCLYVHNMLNGPNFPPEILRLLNELGLHLICPYRAGFGASDPDPRVQKKASQAPDLTSADMQALLAHLGQRQVMVMGYMSGAVFAFNMAQKYPDLVRGVFNISGAVPMTHLGQIRSMNARQRVMALTARFAPRVFPTLLRAGIAQIDSGGIPAFLDALYTPDSPDRAIAELQGNRELLFRGFRDVVAQGHMGFATDSYHVVRDWSRYCMGLTQPVMLVHGAKDPVVSITSAEQFAKSRGYRLLVKDKAGQLVLWQYPRETLQALQAMALHCLHPGTENMRNFHLSTPLGV